MHDETHFGPEIAVDGLPDWVDPDEVIMGKWQEWYPTSTWAHCYADPEAITAIRLRSDHPCYLVIGCDDVDIIGYRKRAEPIEDSGDYVRVKRMTRYELERDYGGFDLYQFARRLDVIREETPLEQFEREHGGLVNKQRYIVEAFIEWQSRNG